MNYCNSVTWCAMIGGHGMQGDSAGSIDLFNEMLKDGVHPNDVAFTSILSTCSHTGMVTAGKKYFNSMAQHFNITPSMKHYACVVDVLARAGNLEQALEFIYKKLKAGAELLFCVLGCKSKRVTVTYKKSLVKSKLDVLASNADAKIGLVIHGWITKIEKHGCFAKFYNGVQGFVSSSVYLALRVLAFTVLGTIVLLNAILQFYLYDSEAFAFLVPFELLSDLSLDYR
ncbi:hypothetical protein PVAP13_3KG101900 [Panicum virgatum]|uniref:Pentatricopeptide repeat-containing protein n=1 Tax=Panicum virgatum TaxID=38727 RepID=A0A8T0V481_PANVG|nr:hypothetical protein PVAP13_3KG101900 [Panicum virgatum]